MSYNVQCCTCPKCHKFVLLQKVSIIPAKFIHLFPNTKKSLLDSVLINQANA